MCPCEWACVRSGEMRGTHSRCAGRRCDDEGVGIHVSVRVGIHVSVRVGIHVSVRVGMCLCEWACVCASGHVSVQVRWEGVTIMKGWESVWGDKTYLCGEMQVGTDAMRVRGNASMWVGQGGIHVRTCRWEWM